MSTLLGRTKSVKRRRPPLPWRHTPPQTMPERWQFAADLAAVLGDPTTEYEVARRVFAASLLGLSGEELFDLGHLVCQQLKTLPTKGGVS